MTRRPLLAVFALLGGCTIPGLSGPYGTDDDDDGFSELVGDCDDGDPDVHPGATERCNGVDDDCNGLIDADDADLADARTWYLDLDGDGYGDDLQAQQACDAPDGHTDQGGDCDDTNSERHPGMAEDCAAVDRDCDGDLYDHALGAERHADADGDGYGDPDVSTTSCVAVDGYVEDASDCDDSRATSHPGATERFDRHDDDCNGVVDDVDLDHADARFPGEAGSSATAGAAMLGLDLSGDGLAEVLVGVPGSDHWAAGAGAVYVFSGMWSGTFSSAEATALLLGETEGDGAGATLASGGDTDGDGATDLLVGAPARDGGAVYLVRWPLQTTSLLTDAVGRLTGESDGDRAGAAMLAPGDLDGDGLEDLVIGAPEHDGSGDGAGAVYLVHGPVQGDQALSDARGKLLGRYVDDWGVGERAGAALATLGDMDGDGAPDLAVGAPATWDSRSAGGVWVLAASPSGTVVLADVGVALTGEAEGDTAGASLASAGDVDGDGYDDLLVGAPRADGGGSNAGTVYLVLGPVTEEGALADADAIVSGTAGGTAGSAVASPGDLDGDGLPEVLIGEPLGDWGGVSNGAAHLFFAPLAGALSVEDADATFRGSTGGDRAGAALAGAGDVDGDGMRDLLFGAPGVSSIGDEAGAGYLVLGALLDESR